VIKKFNCEIGAALIKKSHIRLQHNINTHISFPTTFFLVYSN